MLIVSFGVDGLNFQIIIKIGMQPPMPTSGLALEDPQESSTTGSFSVAQFDSGQKPYKACGNVPIAADSWWQLRSFVGA